MTPVGRNVSTGIRTKATEPDICTAVRSLIAFPERVQKVWSGKLKGRDTLEDLGIDGGYHAYGSY